MTYLYDPVSVCCGVQLQPALNAPETPAVATAVAPCATERSAIIVLPADAQVKARQDLATAESGVADAFVAKDNILQAIQAGANSDWGSLAQSLASAAQAIEALGGLIVSFGADKAKVMSIVGDVKQSQGLTVSRMPAK